MDDHTTPQEFYSRFAREFDRDNAWDNLPESFHSVVEQFLDSIEGEKILDAGCGPGRDTEHFSNEGYDATGLDLAAGMVERAHETREGGYLHADVRDLPFNDQVFDGIWCNTTLLLMPEHEMEEAINELYRVTGTSGVGQISFKLGKGTLEKERNGENVTQYLVSEEKACRMLEESGYTVTSYELHDTPADFQFGNFYIEK